MLRDVEQATYEQIWDFSQYQESGSPGRIFHPIFEGLLAGQGTGTILDAGCGAGKGALELSRLGHHVTLLNLTDQGLIPEVQGMPFVQRPLWDDLRDLGFFDWVYCCDVLEHVPKEFTMLVVARLLQVARKGVFLSISFEPDNFGVHVGKVLHQTVEDFSWWKGRLGELARIVDARDLIGVGTFYLVEP